MMGIIQHQLSHLDAAQRHERWRCFVVLTWLSQPP